MGLAPYDDEIWSHCRKHSPELDLDIVQRNQTADNGDMVIGPWETIKVCSWCGQGHWHLCMKNAERERKMNPLKQSINKRQNGMRSYHDLALKYSSKSEKYVCI